jgi:hypothetical protein
MSLARPAFKLTQRQVRDLIDMTPLGHIPQITISFAREMPLRSAEMGGENTCDEVFVGASD